MHLFLPGYRAGLQELTNITAPTRNPMLAPGMAMQQRYRIVRTIGQGGMGAV
jgi:hypothetical protein